MSERAYVRAIESAWSRLRGRPVVLSPRDYELVAGWSRQGVPLAIVLEVIDHASRRGGGSRSLRFLAPAVREAALVVSSGRAAPVPASAPISARAPAVGEMWRGALEASASHERLHDLLRRVLRRAGEGAAPAELDALIDGEIADAAPEPLVRAASEQARDGLAALRSRMEPAEHERAVARAIADRLRAALDLPRAALSESTRIR